MDAGRFFAVLRSETETLSAEVARAGAALDGDSSARAGAAARALPALGLPADPVPAAVGGLTAAANAPSATEEAARRVLVRSDIADAMAARNLPQLRADIERLDGHVVRFSITRERTTRAFDDTLRWTHRRWDDACRYYLPSIGAARTADEPLEAAAAVVAAVARAVRAESQCRECVEALLSGRVRDLPTARGLVVRARAHGRVVASVARPSAELHELRERLGAAACLVRLARRVTRCGESRRPLRPLPAERGRELEPVLVVARRAYTLAFELSRSIGTLATFEAANEQALRKRVAEARRLHAESVVELAAFVASFGARTSILERHAAVISTRRVERMLRFRLERLRTRDALERAWRICRSERMAHGAAAAGVDLDDARTRLEIQAAAWALLSSTERRTEEDEERLRAWDARRLPVPSCLAATRRAFRVDESTRLRAWSAAADRWLRRLGRIVLGPDSRTRARR